MDLNEATKLIYDETIRAAKLHKKFNSPHEGYAIIKEELDELWDAIRKTKNQNERNEAMKKEAIQTGAMCLRFLMDLL